MAIADNLPQPRRSFWRRAGTFLWTAAKISALSLAVGAVFGAVAGWVTDLFIPSGDAISSGVDNATQALKDEAGKNFAESAAVSTEGVKTGVQEALNNRLPDLFDKATANIAGSVPENVDQAKEIIASVKENVLNTANEAVAKIPNTINLNTASLPEIHADIDKVGEAIKTLLTQGRQTLHTALPVGGAVAGGLFGGAVGAVTGPVTAMTQEPRPVVGEHTRRLAEADAAGYGQEKGLV